MAEISQRRNGPESLFVTTHWSVVLAARGKNSPQSAIALEQLCCAYWYPLYAFVRRLGKSPEDAQDLTQDFFVRLLEKDYLDDADQAKGRFRTFLRVAMRHFLLNQWDRQNRIKRGGGHLHVPFDTEIAENRYVAEHGSNTSPDALYERRWALTLLDQALGRLEEEYIGAGKKEEFAELKAHLTADRGSIPYDSLAQKLKTSEGNVRVCVHRLRKRFRTVFRAEVAETVAKVEDIDEEIRHLVQVLAEA